MHLMKIMMVTSQKKIESELRKSKNRFKKMKNSEGGKRKKMIGTNQMIKG